MIMNKNIPEISVIVCCWNVASTLRRAIDSILTQTFTNFELIIVDDGSPDDCPQIIDEFASVDSRVVPIHKLNGGLSEARNYGLAKASGIYTIFVDPDDWIEKKMLEKLYLKAIEEHSDMVICDYFHNDKYQQTYAIQRPKKLDRDNVLHEILTASLHGYTWNKLIKRKLYTDYNISYPMGIYGCEDMYTLCLMLKMQPVKISYVSEAFYHYVYMEDSLSRHYDKQTYIMDLAIRKMFAQLFLGTKYFREAYIVKTTDIILRAFKYGENTFTSYRFKKDFSKYKSIVYAREKGIMLFLLWLSFNISYKYSHELYKLMFNFKQKLKKMLILFKNFNGSCCYR